jgi:hypothetical protein
MLKKYFDFINENLELILEADIAYSNKFKKVLNKINTPLANKLLEIEDQDHPVQNNYFDIIDDSNDSISFITDRKVKELMGDDDGKVKYTIAGRYLSGDEKFQYLWDLLEIERVSISEPPVGTVGTIRKEVTSPASGKVFVVFVPDDKNYSPIAVNKEAVKSTKIDKKDSVFYKSNRQSIRVGRGIRAIINAAKIEASDKDIEEFVNKFKATIDSINDVFSNFEIVSGDEIAHWYAEKNYDNQKGSLGGSCMKDMNSETFDIYTMNPKNVKLAIYKSPDNSKVIKGRALIWTLDDGKIYMDRIYTNSDSDVELFRQFAKKNGWYCKYYNQSSANTLAYTPDGSSVSLELKVTLSPQGYEYYPYLDTFKFYNPNTYVITTEKINGVILLEDTDGYYIGCTECRGDGNVQCSDCDGDGCEDCDGEGYVDCNNC